MLHGWGERADEMMLKSHLVDKVRFDLESMKPGKRGSLKCELFLKTDQLLIGK